ncbi:glycosyltransferase [Chryseobacterium sp. PBS4-4]|uniref:Glycosyltransferase n=1 Tax=Chryseobacterium edaphi TaxID=2976532 RepID=A0ABT2W9N6_9FLAO|nr:glycosyltransferase [Chryseobacterium edaphi]MCU7618705.1 glycosyltransferase [Chryseobacterium edaphi]
MILSIVVPVYNVCQYIEKCLDSILLQNAEVSKFEIVIVNDGSTDNSLELCKRYERLYTNVFVIDQKNKGLSEARNIGLEASKGQYVWFVDSDDYIAIGSLNLILQSIEKSKKDVIVIGLGEFKEEKLIKSFIPSKIENGIELLKDSNFFVGAVVYIMNIEFLSINHLRFYKGIFHEDEEFVNRMLYLAKNIVSLSELIYCVNFREGSITRSSNPKKSFDMLIVIGELYDFSQSKEDKTIFFNRIGLLFNNALYNLRNSEEIDKKTFNLEYSKRFPFIKKCLLKSDRLVYKVEGLLLYVPTLKPTFIYNFLSIFK